ncbi:MAG: ATP-binding cassette domain-containing protein [Nitrospirae bacterium]|nr:ATP-binding cassette domain-containing protein [Nitrospirota bacterium]
MDKRTKPNTEPRLNQPNTGLLPNIELLKVSGLKRHFPVKAGFFKFKAKAAVRAVDGVDFSVRENRVFALVGESGSGKSTVARIVMRLDEADGGTVLYRGKNVFSLTGGDLKKYRRSVQIVFQDPLASLNPRMTVFKTLAEPLLVHKLVPRTRYREKVVEILEKVGLTPDVMDRYPHEFSGGQRQRVCIARALTLSPEVVVADEPLSALDVSIQAQILNLLIDLKADIGLSFLFISHDLHVVQYFSDEIGVMYLGKIVERGETNDLFSNPLHPYTVMLMDCAPSIERAFNKKSRQITDGDIPSPIDVPPGCPFHPRCPKRFNPCDTIVPRLVEFKGTMVSCHLYD